MVVHDLAHPLRALIEVQKSVKERTPTAEDIKVIFGRLKNGMSLSKSLECGLMDLLDLGQLQNHSFKLNMEYFSLLDVIDQAINIINFKAVQAKVEIVPPALSKAK